MNDNFLSDIDRKHEALRLLREAGELGELCNDYWNDVSRCVELKEEVSYAVDVDVVVLYSDPKGKLSYGRVLSGNNEEVCSAAALLLGDYIVRRMPALLSTTTNSDSVGLVLIPPHDAELQRVGLAISQESMGNRTSSNNSPLSKNEVLLLQQFLNDTHDKGSDHIENVLKLLIRTGLLTDPYQGGGTKLEIARLEALKPGRIIGPRKHPWFQDTGSAMLPPRRPAANDPPEQHVQYRELESMADRWHERLVSIYLDNSKSSKVATQHKGKNILADALALARLEWINRELAKASDKKRRLVLITGSQTLLQAARQVPCEIDGFSDFASAYLRNPRAFLGAKDLAGHPPIQPEASDDKKFTVKDTELHIADWLSVMLPRSVQQDRFERLIQDASFIGTSVKMGFRKPTQEELENAWEGDPNTGGGLRTISDFPKAPIDTLENALRRHAERMNAQAAQCWRSNWAAEINRVVGEHSNQNPEFSIINLLRQRELSSIEALYARTDVVGAVQLLAPSERMRGLPALRFDAEYPKAQQQCNDLCEQLFRPNRPAQFDLNKMEDDLRETDPSGYHARVLKAYVFACAGLWFQVRPLCRSALLAVDAIENKPPNDNRRGREAAYLLAVAERRLANTSTGIDHAEAALTEAGMRNHLPIDRRFNSEDLAQQVTRIQLDYFSKKDISEKVLIKLIDESKALAQDALNEESHVVKRWVVRQSVTNGLLLSLIAKEKHIQPARVSGNARALIELLSKEKQAPKLSVPPFNAMDQQYPDAVSDFVWLVAVAVFGDNKEQRDAAKEALHEEIARQRTSSSSVTYIETVRRAHFLLIAGIDVAS